MKNQISRRSLSSWLLAVAASAVVAACGGGGSATSTGNNQGGVPSVQPDGATFYAGVPNTIVVTGGTRPYTMTSSEPSLLPVPQSLEGGSFQVVPANPGVIDVGLPAGALPVRSVNIQTRDARGVAANTITIKVAQNFLTGYGVGFTSNCPNTGGSSAGAPASCAGGETIVTLRSVTNGNLYGNRPVRFEVIRGPFQFVQLPNTTVVGNTFTTTTDHSGGAIAILRVNPGVSGQFAVLRIVDVATGVYVDEVFPISASAPRTTLTLIPDTFTFTGALTTTCGTGSGDFMVFDGVAPYSATVSDPNLRVTPSSTGSNPGLFTVSAFNQNVCLQGASVIVTDAAGGRGTVTVNTVRGSTPPTPPIALAVQPGSIVLSCGTSGSVSVVGGTGSYILNSTHPRVTAVQAGNTITISRLSGDAPSASFPTTGTVTVSDGSAIASVTLTVPANCP